jgi:hypothetical protein
MLSPFQSDGIHLKLTPIYGESGSGSPMVRNLLHIDANDLTFAREEGKPAVATIGVVAVAMGSESRELARISQSYRLEISPSRLEAALRDGILYPIEVPVTKPGAFQMRVAVRDEGSERIGSASQYIEVPDVKKDKLGLTSILLDEAVGDQDSRFLGMTPAVRRFRRGSVVEYFSLLKGGDESVEPQIRIVREGKPVFTAKAGVRRAEQATAVSGELRLGREMPAGQYYLQILAVAASGRAASQWTDFEVLP